MEMSSNVRQPGATVIQVINSNNSQSNGFFLLQIKSVARSYIKTQREKIHHGSYKFIISLTMACKHGLIYVIT